MMMLMLMLVMITMLMAMNSKVQVVMYGASGWPVCHCVSLVGKYHDDDNFDNDDVHADASDDNFADGDE